MFGEHEIRGFEVPKYDRLRLSVKVLQNVAHLKQYRDRFEERKRTVDLLQEYVERSALYPGHHKGRRSLVGGEIVNHPGYPRMIQLTQDGNFLLEQLDSFVLLPFQHHAQIQLLEGPPDSLKLFIGHFINVTHSALPQHAQKTKTVVEARPYRTTHGELTLTKKGIPPIVGDLPPGTIATGMKIAIVCVAILALLQAFLGLAVSGCRWKYRVSSGCPDDPAHPMFRLRTAFTNCAEWHPVLMALMLTNGMYAAQRWAVFLYPAAVVARWLLVSGLLIAPIKKPNIWRFSGAALTYLLVILFSVLLLKNVAG